MKWTHQIYQSGTQIVISDNPNFPHFYVYGPKATGPYDEEGCCLTSLKIRYSMCKDIVEYLNEGKKPDWFNKMNRVSETVLSADDGCMVFTTGPYYDANPPHLKWDLKEDEESKNRRKGLIDFLQDQNKTIQ